MSGYCTPQFLWKQSVQSILHIGRVYFNCSILTALTPWLNHTCSPIYTNMIRYTLGYQLNPTCRGVCGPQCNLFKPQDTLDIDHVDYHQNQSWASFLPILLQSAKMHNGWRGGWFRLQHPIQFTTEQTEEKDSVARAVIAAQYRDNTATVIAVVFSRYISEDEAGFSIYKQWDQDVFSQSNLVLMNNELTESTTKGYQQYL